MKILKLNFQNLNSLYGEWSIDFTDDAYVQNGIFALTGPTGAGKTTILDAICLALYGRTARLDRITKSANDIMSRQTAECRAEVIFSSQAGEFLCQWSQRRARNKVDGTLQDTAQEISVLEQGSWKLLATKKKDFDQLVEEKTGMDFDRFLRSMLLAQGKFDNFLKADVNTKSAVLEKITGTKIYSEISQRVHRRSATEDEKLKLLRAQTEGIQLLSEQERGEISEQISQNRQQEAQLQTQLKQLDVEIQWHRQVEQLRHELTQAKAQQVSLDTDKHAFAAQGAVLDTAIRADRLKDAYAALHTVREEQTKAQVLQQQLSMQVPQLMEALTTQNQVYQATENTLLDLKKQWEAQQTIWKQVRALDVQLKEQQKRLHEGAVALREVQDRQRQFEREQQNYQEQLNHQEQQLKASERYLSQYAQDKQLVEKLSGLVLSFQQLKQGRVDVLRHQQTHTKRIVALQTLEQAIASLKTDRQSLVDKQQALQQQHREEQQKYQQMTQGKALSYYQQELDHAREKKALIQNIHDVSAIRERLVENEPCPVCGSEHHPYRVAIPALNTYDNQIAQLSTTIRQIEQLEKSVRFLEDKLKDIQHEISLKDSELLNKTSYLEQTTQSLTEEKGQIAELEQSLQVREQQLLSELSVFSVNTLDEASFEQLDWRVRQWQHHVELQEKIQADLQPLREKMAASQAEQKLLHTDMQNRQMRLNEQNEGYAQVQQERFKLFGEQDVDQLERQYQQQIRHAEQQQKQAAEQRDKVKSNLEDAQGRLQQITEGVQQRATQLTHQEERFITQLNQHGFEKESVFIQALLPPPQLLALQAQAKALADRETQLNALITDRTERLKVEENKQLSQTDLVQLETQKQAVLPQWRGYIDQIAAAEERLRQDDRHQLSLADKQTQIIQQEQEATRWKTLKALIGSSDGSAYRNFAQGLTFELMISHANQQLRKMSDRYVLLHDRENALSLNVLDAYQAGEVRSVRNLSGGESFIISLALALGLSKMSSQKIRVDSLFLDEGFGTLDEEALEVALDTLAALHEDNKLIGVISHVSALKNRIGTQIQVEPQHGGRSALRGPGVSRG